MPNNQSTLYATAVQRGHHFILAQRRPAASCRLSATLGLHHATTASSLPCMAGVYWLHSVGLGWLAAMAITIGSRPDSPVSRTHRCSFFTPQHVVVEGSAFSCRSILVALHPAWSLRRCSRPRWLQYSPPSVQPGRQVSKCQSLRSSASPVESGLAYVEGPCSPKFKWPAKSVRKSAPSRASNA